jgi:hypothetical protein
VFRYQNTMLVAMLVGAVAVFFVARGSDGSKKVKKAAKIETGTQGSSIGNDHLENMLTPGFGKRK